MSNLPLDNHPLPLGESINKPNKLPNKARKPSLLTPEDDAWFSEEHILRNGNMYKCLVCPESSSDPNKCWKTRGGMGTHQNSMLHNKSLERKKKKLMEQASVHLALYYPTLSPYEPVEKAVPVYFDPQWLIHHSIPPIPPIPISVAAASKGALKLTKEDYMGVLE
ncbi:hypothetical protein FRC10_006073 [Ceratobasidium sp. 414]|nr:hypothetical protein FRC10_006073 [Ceratobasidium sp. 414]